MTIRGTELLLRLSVEPDRGLVEAVGAELAEEIVAAQQEDLLDLVAAWRRVGWQRRVAVALESDSDAAARRVARRGLNVEPPPQSRGAVASRLRLAAGRAQTVALLDRPMADFSMSALEGLIRRADEGLSILPDLAGGWIGLAFDARNAGILDHGLSLESVCCSAAADGVVCIPHQPCGRLDGSEELRALSLRLRAGGRHAARTRRVLARSSLLAGL